MIKRLFFIFVSLSIFLFTTYNFAITPFDPQGEQTATGTLSKIEQEVISEYNLARAEPKVYANFLTEYAKHYNEKDVEFEGEATLTTNEGVSAVNEAIKFLKDQKPLHKLAVSKGLCISAKDMAKMQGVTKETGHVGTDRSLPAKRFIRQGALEGQCGESIDYGNNNARRIVISLIIDDGIKDRGHRRNIFEPKFRHIGVAFGPHKAYEYMCVIDYAEKYKEK